MSDEPLYCPRCGSEACNEPCPGWPAHIEHGERFYFCHLCGQGLCEGEGTGRQLCKVCDP